MINDILNHANIVTLIADEDVACKFIEFLRWPNGVACVRCGSIKAHDHHK